MPLRTVTTIRRFRRADDESVVALRRACACVGAFDEPGEFTRKLHGSDGAAAVTRGNTGTPH